MKILKYFFFLLLILIIGTSIYIAVQPNEFEFSRSKIIEAPPAVVFNKVNDYKFWPEFSPWIEKEPTSKITYGDTTAGKHATYSWDGEVLGKGKMVTLDSDPFDEIEQKIVFIEPFNSESNINWKFESVENGTKVTWAMSGEQDFMTKMYTTFMGSIEQNTAPDFERGLFKLDSIVVADMSKYTSSVNGLVDHSGGFYIYTTSSCKIDEVESKMRELMPKVGGYAISNNISFAGSPFSYIHKWDTENNAAIISFCIPTTSRVITSEDDILTGQLEPFKAVKATLKGNYDHLTETWEKALQYIEQNEISQIQNGPMLEVYVTDPNKNPNPAEWITEIYIAVDQQ